MIDSVYGVLFQGISVPWGDSILSREFLSLQWQYERRLVFVAAPTWMGWYCERCCWHLKLGDAPTSGGLTVNAHEKFEAHDCEQFARENWNVSSDHG